jgi:hypothetical protein
VAGYQSLIHREYQSSLPFRLQLRMAGGFATNKKASQQRKVAKKATSF